MLNKINKIIMIVIVVLIILLLITILAFVVISNNNENEKHENISKYDNSQVVEIQQIENKDENEVLVAFLDGEPNSKDSGIIVIGANENYNEEINNVIENNKSPYYIKINVQANVVTLYKKDGNGNYNIPLKAMICSCGSATPTEGTYSLKKYNNWDWKTIYGGYGRYATQISGDILFSSVPYNKRGDKTSLKYDEYDKLGTIASVGNIVLTVRDAKWIYDNCPAGTQVTFYASEIPSPLNLTKSQLITEDIDVRGWDPTDPDENNPWKTYVRPEKKPETNTQENNNENQANNTTQNNTQTNNNSIQNNNSEGNNNKIENNTITNSTTTNNVSENNINNTINNNIQNNQLSNNKVVENKILEKNNDVTIKSEIIDTNNI